MAMAAKQGSSPTVNRANQFGSFARDPNHQYITKENYPYYQDATGTPVKSPVTVAAATAIIIPAAATSVVLCPAVAMRVSDTSDGSSGYFVIPANAMVEVPLVTPGSDVNDTTGKLWLTNDSTSGACSFFFKCV